jgi:thermitase
VVAVVGSSVDKSVADINDALIEEANQVRPKEKGGSGEVADDAQIYDISTTMAARLIVGSPNSDIVGVAPGVRLISERVANAQGVGTSWQLLKGFEHAMLNRARIIYVGLQMDQESSSILEHLMSRIQLVGGLPIAAAGSSDSETKVFPAAIGGVLAVAATDVDDRKASYSNYGDWVSIAAPGNPIVSSQESRDATTTPSLPGTNFAAAIVTGAAALVWSVNPSLSAGDVYKILVDTADNIDNINPSFRHKLGAGRINVLQAVQTAARGLHSPSP